MSVYQNDIEMEDIDRIIDCMQSFPMVERLLAEIKKKNKAKSKRRGIYQIQLTKNNILVIKFI